MDLENTLEKAVPLTRIQKLISKRMHESKQAKPCFYIETRADVTKLMAIRPKLRKSAGVKVTTNAFYIYTLSHAVTKFPMTVAMLDGDNYRIAEHVNVGFAVQAPQGLVVPVVKDADRKSLAEIAKEEKSLTEKARDNQLTLEEMEGETIALSNLGAYDIDSFIGIVPPPATTILAIGKVIPTLVPIDGKPAERKIVTINLAADHTVIDGVYAAGFLKYIKEELENPGNLI
jgi:pyruvate dehydrogenase E2 component (dihydrolipoamide acetyltransferase)